MERLSTGNRGGTCNRQGRGTCVGEGFKAPLIRLGAVRVCFKRHVSAVVGLEGVFECIDDASWEE